MGGLVCYECISSSVVMVSITKTIDYANVMLDMLVHDKQHSTFLYSTPTVLEVIIKMTLVV